MAIAVTTTKNTMATYYGTQGTWIGLATANPGSVATPTASTEVTGGSPAYARKQTTWGAASGGAITGTAVTIDTPAATVTYIILASAAVVATANMIDNAAVTSVVMSGQGQIVVTPTYTQT
jgi:hypothetical protein